jgi:hypothetical protein
MKILPTLATCLLIAFTPGRAAEPIPEETLTTLRQELSAVAGAEAASEGRRLCRRIIRQAQTLLTESPTATNRFAVLGLIHDAQKRLLSLENTQENRDALFATAEQLRAAPHDFAELRLDAELLLMEKSMGEKKATVAQRIEALEALLDDYRGTVAEGRSLVIGSMIASRLSDLELVKRINERKFERFAGDHAIIQQWRADNTGERFDAVFFGTYETGDGTTLSLPIDRWGQPYLVIFWSEKNPRIDDHLREAKEFQAAHPGALQVLSFNLDELPDAGKSKLQSLGLDWTAMRLPGGRTNPTFRAYAAIEPQAFIVNAQGRVMLDSPAPALGLSAGEGTAGRNISDFAWQLDDSRYLAQLRSLFIGDFLITPAASSSSIPTNVIQPIQDCFVAPPFRFRLTRNEELANYRKALELTTAALTSHAESSDAWQLRNRKIIALIGLWNLTGDTTHLTAASTEAELILATAALPPEADIVARFALTKAALRESEANPESLIAEFIAKSGGEKAPAAALAAAATLAIEGNARGTHEIHRARLLALGEKIDDSLWPVRAFLLDRHHRHRNFFAIPGGLKERKGKAGYRVMLSGLDEPLPADTRITLELKTPEGATLTLPKDKANRRIGVIFAEPSADAETQTRLIDRAKAFASAFKQYPDVEVVVVWLTDDAKIAQSMASADNAYQVTTLPGGLKNPLVGKLGILSADRMPNLLLYRTDGTVAWSASGLLYRYAQKAEGPDLPVRLAIENNLEKLTSDAGFIALERGDYQNALQLFDSFAPKRPRTNWWHADRTHARALAQMGLKDWEAALTTIDTVLQQRTTSVRCKCHGIVEILLTKAMILDQLKRPEEAQATRALVEKETQPHIAIPPGQAYGVGIAGSVYYDWLKRIRLAMPDAEK